MSFQSLEKKIDAEDRPASSNRFKIYSGLYMNDVEPLFSNNIQNKSDEEGLKIVFAITDLRHKTIILGLHRLIDRKSIVQAIHWMAV